MTDKAEQIVDVKEKVKTAKILSTLGKRTAAIARATARRGTGIMTINSRPISLYQPELAKLKIEEPLILAGDLSKQLNIDVHVSGGGVMGQADAIRQAIATA